MSIIERAVDRLEKELDDVEERKGPPAPVVDDGADDSILHAAAAEMTVQFLADGVGFEGCAVSVGSVHKSRCPHDDAGQAESALPGLVVE